MAIVNDVIFKADGIVVFFNDGTRVEGQYKTIGGVPTLVGINASQRQQVLDFYNKSSVTLQADLRYLTFLQAVTTDSHATIDHSGLPGVGGGAGSGETRRIYFDLFSARLPDSSSVLATGSTTPTLLTTGSPRIQWPVGNTDRVGLIAYIPFEDVLLTPSFSTAVTVVLSQSGTELIESTSDFDLAFSGGNFSSIAPGSAEWPQTAVPTVTSYGTAAIFDLGAPITDVRSLYIEINPVAHAVDTCTLHEAWCEITLK